MRWKICVEEKCVTTRARAARQLKVRTSFAKFEDMLHRCDFQTFVYNSDIVHFFGGGKQEGCVKRQDGRCARVSAPRRQSVSPGCFDLRRMVFSGCPNLDDSRCTASLSHPNVRVCPPTCPWLQR